MILLDTQVQTPFQYAEQYLRTLTWPMIIIGVIYVMRFFAKAEAKGEAFETKFNEIHVAITNHQDHKMDKLIELAERQDKRMDAWMIAQAAKNRES